MKRSLLMLLLGASLSAGTPARAELDEIGLMNAEIQASACARYYQLFAAYDLEFLVPDLRATVLGRVSAQGASEAQLDHLERLYDATRARAAEFGLEPGSRKPELDRAYLAILQREADIAMEACDRKHFSLYFLQPPPADQPGVDKDMLRRLREHTYQCGMDSALSAGYGFDSLYPDYREVTLENARRHGASDSQIEEIGRRFEEGVLKGGPWVEDWDDEIALMASDEEYRVDRENVFGQSYGECAGADLRE